MSRCLRSLRRSPAALAGAALAVASCGADGDLVALEFGERTTPPGSAELGPDRVVLERGVAVRARVWGETGGGERLEVLSLETADPEVLGLARGPRLGTWVLYGIREGATEVVVLSRGDEVGRVPAFVTR